MLHKSHRRGLRKRHKRMLAAVAGAAVLSSAVLPGMPMAQVQAAPATKSVADTATNQSAAFSRTDSPVRTVIERAGSLGLDPYGRYSLLSHSKSKATVSVRSNGQTFKVDLVRRGGNWVVTTIRGIGDSNTPATYRTVSNGSYITLPASGFVPMTLGTSQQILFQTSNYNTWTWGYDFYPQGMDFGVLLQNPRLAGTTALVPKNIPNLVNNINFSDQLVLYAHLGNVDSRGYGIGISQVAQTGNNLTVTVNMKSPIANVASGATKPDDVVPLDRASLNFGAPIHVTFVDANGTALGNYVINPS
ncbi:MAG TPA: hypothetical protein PKA10_18195 [Selenomonadales bacterium]|nr:hypothetical protein [Selenomonadales bacterium]